MGYVVEQVDPTLDPRLDNLENNEFKILYFESISSTTGAITKPTNSTILLDQFYSGGDAIVETLIDGMPSGQSPLTIGGAVVSVLSFDIAGNYVLSGTPSSYPIALVYVFKTKAIDYSYVDIAKEINREDTSFGTIKGTLAATPGLIPFSTGVLDTIQGSSNFTYDETNFIAKPSTLITHQIGTTSSNAMYRLDSVGFRIGTVATVGTANTAKFEVDGAAKIGSSNTNFGLNSLATLTSGTTNVAFGLNTLNKLTSGFDNTAIGNGALINLTTANKNVAIGVDSGASFTTGSMNVCVGALAGYLTSTGTQNTYLGTYAGSGAGAALSGRIFLGYGAGSYSTSNNELYISNTLTAITTEAQAKTRSIIYGQMNSATLANQLLTVNGGFRVQTTETSTDTAVRVDAVGMKIGTVAGVGTANTFRLRVDGTSFFSGATEIAGTFYAGSLISNIISSSSGGAIQGASAFVGLQRSFLASNTSTATLGNGASLGYLIASGGTQTLCGDLFCEVTNIGVGTVTSSIGVITRVNGSLTQAMYINGAGIGIGDSSVYSRTLLPTAFIDISPSTTAKASLRIRSGVAPTVPNNGDTINVSGVLKFYDGTQWNNINRPDYLTAGAVTALLENVANWSVTGQYTGTAITGTFQGQKHYDTNYFFECVLDNNWIRLIRG